MTTCSSRATAACSPSTSPRPAAPRRLTDTETLHVVGDRIVPRGGRRPGPVREPRRGRPARASRTTAASRPSSAPGSAGDREHRRRRRHRRRELRRHRAVHRARHRPRRRRARPAHRLRRRRSRRCRSPNSRRRRRTASSCTASSSSRDGDGPHPVLLMIHGGPFAAYTWRVFDEAQVYADAGYAVVYTNPRGSSGYGESYGRHIRGDVGAPLGRGSARPAGRSARTPVPGRRARRRARRFARRLHDELAGRAQRPVPRRSERARGQRDRQLHRRERHRLEFRGRPVRSGRSSGSGRRARSPTPTTSTRHC